MTTTVISPNTQLMPISAEVNDKQHLTIGELDTVELAKEFGTPLYIMDYATIEAAATACKIGLADYPDAQVLYAGKAFLCLAMCHIVKRLGLGLDVVSEGELYTALKAEVPLDKIFMHGNNKSDNELRLALKHKGVKIVVDSFAELIRLDELAAEVDTKADIMVRVIPGVEPDTHDHIKTGQTGSKFGINLEDMDDFAVHVKKFAKTINFLGLHAHIGSQTHELKPYQEIVEILADLCLDLKMRHEMPVPLLDVGGGIGIAYVREDKPLPLYDWASNIATAVEKAFLTRALTLPQLIVEPGRAIVGPAGVTLYQAGRMKHLPDGTRYVGLDGGMADNPRPITYNARYTAAIANRMNAPKAMDNTTLVGRYCESGDIIVRDAGIPAETGDTIAVFGTGAYNYSMASNYNRTGRPACVLVRNGSAEVILERESNDDLLKQDRVPSWLTKE